MTGLFQGSGEQRLRLAVLLLGALVVVSCSGNPAPNPWETYDYRHPVPSSSGVRQQSEGLRYPERRYQDNDNYYTPPRDFGCDPDNIYQCQ